jgi:ribosome-binding factor A
MSRVMRRRKRVLPCAGEAHRDQGHLPAAAFAAASSADAKSLQLCEQARRALEFAFDHECRDERLAELVVVEVMPDPGVRRLRVWLRGPADMDEECHRHIVERLAAARGFLRAQVAGAIHRKRTPELAFELLRGLDGVEESRT